VTRNLRESRRNRLEILSSLFVGGAPQSPLLFRTIGAWAADLLLSLFIPLSAGAALDRFLADERADFGARFHRTWTIFGLTLLLSYLYFATRYLAARWSALYERRFSAESGGSFRDLPLLGPHRVVAAGRDAVGAAAIVFLMFSKDASAAACLAGGVLLCVALGFRRQERTEEPAGGKEVRGLMNGVLLASGSALGALLAGALLVGGRITPGEVCALFLLAGFLVSPARGIVRFCYDLRFVEGPAECRETIESNLTPEPQGPPLAFENVVLYEDPEREPVLDGVSFTVERGEIVGLLDPTGRAIGAIAALVRGEAGVRSGKVTVFGRPPTAAGGALVLSGTEEPEGATIEESVRKGKPEASITEIIAAARNAGVTEFLPYLPRGLATSTHDPSSVLSPGQKRRILLARAFLMRPRVLVLDRFFSGVDRHSALILSRALETGRRVWAALLLEEESPDPVGPPTDRFFFYEGGSLRSR